MVVGGHVLVDLGAVHVDLDDLGLRGKGCGVQCHAVGEAAAHGDQQIALVGGHVGSLGTVHADHAGGEGVVAGETAAAHQGDSNGSVHLFGKLTELLVGTAANHAAAADQQRLLGLLDHLQQDVHVVLVGLGLLGLMDDTQILDAAAGAIFRPVDEFVFDLLIGTGDVLQEVDQDGAGTAAGGHGECLTHHVGDLVGIAHQEGCLGDGHGDAGGVNLLEGVLTQQVFTHVAGDEHHGRGIQISGGNTGGQVGGTGSGGGETNAYLAGRTGITVGCMGSALLVGGQDMTDLALIAVELIIQVQDRTAGITENGIDVLLQQTLHDGLCCADLQNTFLLCAVRR